jgi:protein-disulfide isomerase
MDRYPEQVALVFHHFPLPSHQHAAPAAIAAECADRQGRFWPMYRTLLAGQRTFGSVAWKNFAQEAGVPDHEAFAACLLLSADSFPRISEGIALGQRAGVVGTPTTWINGRVMRPSDAVLSKLLK